MDPTDPEGRPSRNSATPRVPDAASLQRAEAEALLAEMEGWGARKPGLRLIVVEWRPAPGAKDRDVIQGPLGYRHPVHDDAAPPMRKQPKVRGVQLIADDLARPRARRAYAMLIDPSDPNRFNPLPRFPGLSPKPSTVPLLHQFTRAGSLVQHLPGPRALGPRPHDEFPWLMALLDLTEPDERFAWDEWARKQCPPGTFPAAGTLSCPLGREFDAAIPVCYHVKDVVLASQVALRRLLHDFDPAPAERRTPPPTSGTAVVGATRHPPADHSEGFEWIEVAGTRYDFHKPQQRAVVKVLWELAGKPLHEDTIGELIGLGEQSEDVVRFRLHDVFRGKEGMNPAFGTVIKSAGKRTRLYRLLR